MSPERLPLTVVVPTIGRTELLAGCLSAIARCDPQPDEVVLVDNPGSDAVRELAPHYEALGVRVVVCESPGVGRAVNLGFEVAGNEAVAVTNDDCTPQVDWVATAHGLIERHQDAIVCGRVRAKGDPRVIPSLRDERDAEDIGRDWHYWGLTGNNFVARRSVFHVFGGFDERFDFAAEDSDFSYRWLRGGGRMRYEPALVVWHESWRTPAEMREQYVRYWNGGGLFYAKHLRRGDRVMLYLLARDLVASSLATLIGAVSGRPSWTDTRRGCLRGLPAGLRRGWRLSSGPARR